MIDQTALLTSKHLTRELAVGGFGIFARLLIPSDVNAEHTRTAQNLHWLVYVKHSIWLAAESFENRRHV